MTKSILFTTFAAAALAFGLAACDEQQASDTSSVPMQQQGAVPEAGSTTAPMAPDSGSPAATPEETPQPDGSEPESTLPGSSQ